MHRKSLWLKNILLTAASTLLLSTAALAADPLMTYTEAVRHRAANPDGQYTVHVAYDMPFFKGAVKEMISLQANPFAVKVTAQAEDASLPTLATTVTAYSEVADKEYHFYYGVTSMGATQWYVVSGTADAAMVGQSLTSLFQVFGDGITAVRQTGSHTYVVEYDTNRLGAMLKPPAAENKTADKILRALKQNGTYTVTATLDSTDKALQQLTFPMTPQLQGLLAVLAEDYPRFTPPEREIIRQYAENATLDVTLTIAPLPPGEDLRVPAAVKKVAVPITDGAATRTGTVREGDKAGSSPQSAGQGQD